MSTNLQMEGQHPAASLTDEVAELFLVHRLPLLRYLQSLGLPVAVGEEVVQEVFLALFHHLRQDRPRQNLRGWIFRVGHNLGLREQLRIARKATVDLDDQEPTAAPNPEQEAAQSERQRRLLAIVRALPAEDRHCLLLRAEGLRYREIAETMGLSVGSVAANLSRALFKLTKVGAL